MRSPQKRRALLLLRAVFRLAGVLERASAKDGGDKLGCSSFLDMARDSFDFYVMKTPIMRDVVLAAADLVFGNGIERTDFTDERYDRFAGAAVGWSEAVFRWAPSSGKTSTEWAELMSLGTRVMRSLSNHARKRVLKSARRRGDLALALASAARGVASLSSSTATRRRFRCRARRGARARESRDTVRRRRAGFDLLGRDRTIARPRSRRIRTRLPKTRRSRFPRRGRRRPRCFRCFRWRTSTS